MELNIPVELWRRCAGSGDIPDVDLAMSVRALYATDDPDWTRAEGWWHTPNDPGELHLYQAVVLVHTDTLPAGASIGPPRLRLEGAPAVQRLTLHRNRWERLPDTWFEVGLHGKLRGGLAGDAATVEVFRTGHPDRRLAGWDIRPLHGLIDVRPHYKRRVMS